MTFESTIPCPLVELFIIEFAYIGSVWDPLILLKLKIFCNCVNDPLVIYILPFCIRYDDLNFPLASNG